MSDDADVGFRMSFYQKPENDSGLPEVKEYGIPPTPAYEIIEYLGRGAWTPVFLATRKSDGSKWALKFLRPNEDAQGWMQERGWTIDDYWKRESLNGEVPTSPHIAQNFVDVAANGEKFLAEKYLGERFLDDYLEEAGTPSQREAIFDIGRGMAAALEVQHTKAGGNGMPHGDVAPKNFAYSFARVITLSDFGTATISGKGVGDRGYELTKAVEEFSKSGVPTKEGDVFSFGSIVYRLFTGKYALQDEFERFGRDHMKYLAENPEVWNSTIDTKLKDEKVPKEFRKLLKRCLTTPDKRIKDGAELVKELEKAARKYEKRGHTAVTIIGVAAAAGLLGAIGLSLYKNHTKAVDEQKLLTAYERKVRVIKMDKKTIINDSSEWWPNLELESWKDVLEREEGITDKWVVNAFFLDPEKAYEAVQQTGKRDYDGIRAYIYNKYPGLSSALSDAKGTGYDNWQRVGTPRTAREDEVLKKLRAAKKAYESKKEEPDNFSGIVGPVKAWGPKPGEGGK